MSQMSDQQSLKEAGLQDIPLTSVVEQFQDVLARNSPLCDSEYGTRDSDSALVFHFFPPGYAADSSKDWPSWTEFRDRLEASLMKYFPIESVDAGYAEELKSFFLIVSPRPSVPDLTALIERFFSDLGA